MVSGRRFDVLLARLDERWSRWMWGEEKRRGLATEMRNMMHCVVAADEAVLVRRAAWESAIENTEAWPIQPCSLALTLKASVVE